MEGYIKFFRNFLNWEWYQDANVVRLYIHCMLRANFEDKQWRGITIKKGSFLTSYQTLSNETNLSVTMIRGAIKKLVSSGYLKSESSSKYTVLTINDWEITQSKEIKKTIKKSEPKNEFKEEREMRFGGNYYAVKKRDKYKCTECNSRNSLVVHHIIPYDPDNELTIYKENLITVCKECHNRLHFLNKFNFPILPKEETLNKIGFNGEFIVAYESILEEFKNGNL